MVVPHMCDQWDNGHCVGRLGFSKVLPAAKCSSDQARDVLADLLCCRATAHLTENIARQVRSEIGAIEAAKLILSKLR